MRVVPPEVGPDEVPATSRGVVLGHPGGDEEAGGEVESGSGRGGSARRLASGIVRWGVENPILRDGNRPFAIRADRRSNTTGDPRHPDRGPRAWHTTSTSRTTATGPSTPCATIDRRLRLDPPVLRLQPLRPPPARRRRGPADHRGRRRLRRQPQQARPQRHRPSSSRSRTGSGTASIRSAGSRTRSPSAGKVHAIHGFAIAAKWDVVEHGANDRRGLPRRPVPPGRAFARVPQALADRRHPDRPLRPLGPSSCR